MAVPQRECVWCPNCNGVQSVLYARMGPDALNDHAATDLLYESCRFIVATLHHPDGLRCRNAAVAASNRSTKEAP